MIIDRPANGFVAVLSDYDIMGSPSCIGDTIEVVKVTDNYGHDVTGCYDRLSLFPAWTRRRLVRRLRKEWCARYVG